MEKPLLEPVEDSDLNAALIGLGRRGCECVQRLYRAGIADTCSFLIDHDPDSRQEDAAPPRKLSWIGSTETLPDFSSCALLGIVIVGAEHQDKTEQLSLKLGLFKERPALLLGIVLPPPSGQSIRLRSEVLKELDCIAWWPGDPILPEWGALLHIAVSDWIAAVLGAGLVCIDISDVMGLFCGASQPLMIASASAALTEPQKAAYSALTDLYDRGFKPEQTTGLLVVIRASMQMTIPIFEAVTAVFEDILPDTATFAATTPIETGLQGRLRVTLFAAGPFAAPPDVARTGLYP